MAKPNPHTVLRVLALPIRRHPTPLTYYHVIAPPPLPPAESGTTTASSSRATYWMKRGVGKAVELWDGMGDEKRPATSWQRRVYAYGTRAMSRIPFEETALKAVDVTALKGLQSQLQATLASAQQGEKVSVDSNEMLRTVVLHPSIADKSLDVRAAWANFLQERVPLHRRGAFVWAGVAPLTAPFMLIPIIPNFPFFFCVWRSWSHYAAFNAARFLSTLPITTKASPELDAIFASTSTPNPTPLAHASTTSSSSSVTSAATLPPAEDAVLTHDRVDAVTKQYGLSVHAHAELLRAIEQAAKRTEDEAKR